MPDHVDACRAVKGIKMRNTILPRGRNSSPGFREHWRRIDARHVCPAGNGWVTVVINGKLHVLPERFARWIAARPVVLPEGLGL